MGMVVEPERAVVVERRVFAPGFKSETFIVPVVGEAVMGAIERYVVVAAREGKAGAGVEAGAGATVAAGGKALDVGCGGQPFRGVIEGKGFRYFGLDAHPTEGVAVDFVCAIDGELPAEVLAAGPCGFIFCTEVLEHVAVWGKAVLYF